MTTCKMNLLIRFLSLGLLIVLLIGAVWSPQALGFADVIHIEVLDGDSSAAKSPTNVCDALVKALLADSGPMGLGIFSRSQCIKGDTSKSSKAPQTGSAAYWRLQVLKANENTFEFNLSLIMKAKASSQAKMTLPGISSFTELSEVLQDPRISWLLGLGILDQLPVMGRVSARLKPSAEGLYSSVPDTTSQSLGLQIQYKLVPVKILFVASSEIWNVTAIPPNQRTTNESPSYWLANTRSRSENLKDITEAINAILEERKQNAIRKAQDEARRAAEEERLRELALQTIPRLPDLDGSTWANLGFSWSDLPNKDLRGLTSRLTLGSNYKFIHWVEVYAQFDRFAFDAKFFSTDEASNPELTQLQLSEITFGLGTSGRFDLTASSWMHGGAFVSQRSQSLKAIKNLPADFQSNTYNKSGLLGLRLTGGLRLITGRFLSGLDLEVEALVPHFQESQRATIEASTLFLFTRAPGTGKEDDGEPESTLDVRFGPCIRSDFQKFKRTLDKQLLEDVESEPTVQVSLINFGMGITGYVAF